MGKHVKRNRVLLARGASATALSLIAVLASAYGCSGADDAPPSQVGSGGSGGSTSSSGGSSGTNDSGLLEVGVPPDPNCTDKTDSDGDSIADQLEGDGDTDGDGTPDKDDLDSDDDGVSDEDEAGTGRSDPCSPVANTDQNDDGPDFQDFDADSDGVIDSDEKTGCDNDCRITADCDEDGVVDIVEQAAGSDDCDVDSLPADASLYFIVPFNGGPQTQRFKFSTGIKEADIYFMIDTTNSMQPAIDNVKASLNTKIIPSILNGDASASPPIPAIPGAYIGVGDFKDVPWPPYGNSTDSVYRTSFCVGGSEPGCTGGSIVKGDLAAPKDVGGSFEAPDSVQQIINSFTQSGGGDAPESVTQALYLASTSSQYAVTGGGIWPAPDAACDAGLIGRACFRPGKLPLFVIITDAAFHNGPQSAYDYGPDAMGSIQPYPGVVDALNGIGAKIVGIPVDTGVGAAAKSDLEDLAEKTGSTYSTPSAPGVELPLVTKKTKNGDVATEVVRLIGLLAGQGLKNVHGTDNDEE